MDKDSDNLDWLIDGMKTLPLNKTATRCFSNHFTNFAVLMQISALEISGSDRKALDYLSIFGCCVSITCLFISFVLLVLSRLQTDKVFVLKNMVFMMFWAQILFLTGVDKTHLPVVCKVIAALLHYLFLTVIMWMFSQGIQLYIKVSYITSQASHWIEYTLISYVIPAVIVAISLIKSHRNYGYAKYCWLAPSEGLMFAFVGPALFVIIVNLLVLIRVLKTFNSVQINARKSDQDKFKASVRACFVLLPLLGTSWILGVFALDNTNTVFFQYLFVLLNMLKGILVLVFHVLLNDDVTSVVFKKYGCRPRGKVIHISDKPGTKSSGLSPVDGTHKTTRDRYSLFLVKSFQKTKLSKSDNLQPRTSSK
ncbi:adhesion G-protein coupled receptor D1 [Patella vulgata]|uniref:adhesion G-protein coupled receptor D1 n=1 Tax=Patella vulgata TaxID=6465 RepID=UPI0024A8BC98|nr:adhesion G-protein coupled receptor D1 [Patella vulgata]